MDTSSPKNVHARILRTLALGDVVDTALTPLEVWQQLEERVTLGDVVRGLSELATRNIVIQYRGRYALCGRGVLFAERARRYRASVSKWRRARLFLTLVAALPGVSAVGFYNALGYGNARVGSDIDIVLIAKKNWIWRVRLAAVVLAELFGHRPKPGKIRDGLCLSFFFTPSADLARVKHAHDPFLPWWLTRMHMVFDERDAYRRWHDNNPWIKSERPNATAPLSTTFLPERLISGVRMLMRVVLFPLFLMSDARIKHLSKKFGSKALWRAAEAQNTSVIMQDDLLKLHLTDRREAHAHAFERRAARAVKQWSV